MADVSLKIGAVIDELDKKLNEAKGKLSQFAGWVEKNEARIKKARLGSAAALAGGILIMRDLTKAYAAQEQAEAGLAQAMKTAGTYTDAAFKSAKDYASELQRLTIFDDDATKGAMALLVSIGRLSGEGLERATAATADFAQAMGMDIASAASVVAKSIGGSTNMLARYGVTIDDGVVGPQQRMLAITEKIAAMFEGRAAAAANTQTGALTQLGNAWGDIKEDLGEAILPMLVSLAKAINDVLPKLSEFIKNNKTLVAVLAGGGVGGAGLILVLSQFALAFTNPVTGIIAVVALAAIGIAALVGHFKDLEAVVKTTNIAAPAVPYKIMSQEELDSERDRLEHYIETLKNNRAELVAEITSIREADGGDSDGGYLQNLLVFLEKRELQIADATAKLKEIAMTVPSSAGGVGGVGMPADIEQPTFPGIPTEEDLELAAENLQTLYDMEAENYERLAELGQAELTRIEEEMERRKEIITIGLQAVYDIWGSSFAGLAELSNQYNAAILVAAMQGFINMLKMMVDVAMQEIVARKIKAIAELTISGILGDWSAWGKIAAIGAAAGVAKAGLSALLGKATAGLQKSVPAYEYGGRVNQTGLAMMHAGEHVFNPDHPMESIRNGSGVSFNYNHYGNTNNKRDIDRAFRDFEARLTSRRLAGGFSR